jgi:hypothetical protein
MMSGALNQTQQRDDLSLICELATGNAAGDRESKFWLNFDEKAKTFAAGSHKTRDSQI